MSIPFTWIYLVYDPLTGLFKIGKADNPTARVKQLCSPSGTIPAAPQEYELLEAWLAPERDEAGMHRRYAECRVRGEWFDLRSHFLMEPFEGDCYEICSMFGANFEICQRWIEGKPERIESLEISVFRLSQEVEVVQALKRQIGQARLLGFMPKQLAAAPFPTEVEAIAF